MTDDLVGRLQGPVQWGYMCLTDGGFIADDTPLEAAARIEALEGENRKLRADLIARSDEETVAVCVQCQARLFDGDDFVSDPMGEASGCWKAMTDIVPKHERPCFAYRAALTPEAPHAD